MRPAVPAPEISARFGAGAVTSLARRGLVELESTAVDRLPYADRDRHVPAVPAGAALGADQARAATAIVAAVEQRRPLAFLLGWCHRGGQDRRLRRRHRGRPPAWVAAPSCWCRRSPSPRRFSTACGTTWRRRSPSSTPASGTASAPTSGGASVTVVSASWSARGPPSSRPSPTSGVIVVDEEHDAALQVRPDAALPGARHGHRARAPRARSGRPRRARRRTS